MRSSNAGPAMSFDSPGCGVPLGAEELGSIQGGAFPIVGLIAGAFALSVVVGMIDAMLFGDCGCRLH